MRCISFLRFAFHSGEMGLMRCTLYKIFLDCTGEKQNINRGVLYVKGLTEYLNLLNL